MWAWATRDGCKYFANDPYVSQNLFKDLSKFLLLTDDKGAWKCFGRIVGVRQSTAMAGPLEMG
jgi:hypothetical protein